MTITCLNCKKIGTVDDGFILVRISGWNMADNYWLCPECKSLELIGKLKRVVP